MPKVIFTTQHEVEMDETSESSIVDMAQLIANGGKNDVEGIVQSIKIKDSFALPEPTVINCMQEAGVVPATI